VKIISNYEKSDKDLLLFMFLDEVFTKNKELSKDFHAQQIELYMTFNK
jgi:hypothetical protein